MTLQSIFSRARLRMAALATLTWAAITGWTRYPFLVDEYSYLWQAYRPGFSPLSFDTSFAQRPFAVLQNYLMFQTHVFEHTKVLFFVYYFLQCLGVLGILAWIVEHLGSSELKKGLKTTPAILGAIVLTVLLSPGWFEITLMFGDLAFGSGVLLLALALHAKRPATRTFLLLLCFTTYESYIFPALVLLSLPVLRDLRSPRAWKVWIPAISAGLGLLIVQRILFRYIALRSYVLNFDLLTLLATAWLYAKMLWIEAFYKANWVATVLEWIAVLGTSVALIRKDSKRARTVAAVLLLPALGAAHGAVLNRYFAPRAIHGAMVIKACVIALLLGELAVRTRSKIARWIPVGILAVAFLTHHALIVYSRGTNGRQVEAKLQAIETQLKTCQSPCTILASDLSDDLMWDWIMVPMYHEVVVRWLAAKNGIQKDLKIISSK